MRLSLLLALFNGNSIAANYLQFNAISVYLNQKERLSAEWIRRSKEHLVLRKRRESGVNAIQTQSFLVSNTLNDPKQEPELSINLEIGPIRQLFSVSLDTCLNTKGPLVPSFLCFSKGCYTKNKFNSSFSQRPRPLETFSLQLPEARVQGVWVLDTLNLIGQPKMTLVSHQIGEILYASDEFASSGSDGVLGLGPGSGLVPSLFAQGIIKRPILSLYISKKEQSRLSIGSLVYNQNERRFKNEIKWFPSVSREFWEVPLLGFELIMTGNESENTNDIRYSERFRLGRQSSAVLDTATQWITIPSDFYKLLMRKYIKAFKVPFMSDLDLYPCNFRDMPSVSFVLGNGHSYTLRPEDYSIRVWTVDLFKFEFGLCNSVFVPVDVEEGGNGQFVLGTSFLARFYTVFDYDRGHIGFSPIVNS